MLHGIQWARRAIAKPPVSTALEQFDAFRKFGAVAGDGRHCEDPALRLTGPLGTDRSGLSAAIARLATTAFKSTNAKRIRLKKVLKAMRQPFI